MPNSIALSLVSWLSLAWGAVPEGVDLDDTQSWSAAADALLDGPPGCWEVVGVASWRHDYKRFGASRGDAAFAGRLQDGVWTWVKVESMGEVVREGREPERLVYREEPSFVPLVGKLSEGFTAEASDGEGGTVAVESERNEPHNALRAVLDELRGETSVSYVEWDDAAEEVVLREVATVGSRARAPEIELVTHFPGGRPIASRLEVHFPESFPINAVPRVGVHGARVELYAQPEGGIAFPAAEVWHFDLRAIGMAFSSSQTLAYRQIARCPAGG